MSELDNLVYQQKYRFIRWDFWIPKYDVAIYEAILLSLNFDPENINYPKRRWATELKSSDRIALDERVEIIETHIGNGKTFDCEDGFLSCRVNLKDFSIFLKKVHLTMPPVLESYANNESNLQEVINQYEAAFHQQSHKQSHNMGDPIVGHAPPEHCQKQRDQLLKEKAQWLEEKDQLLKENVQLKARIAELEANQQNSINADEINIENSDLIFIAVLMKMLRNEIKVAAKKSQAKILQKIEDEHNKNIGLSKSRTDKVMAKANKLYKSLNLQQMQ